MRRAVFGALIVAINWAGLGCAPPASEGGFGSDNPASTLYAIRRAEKRDIPRLVEQLENDDPAARMLAIEALERLTGRRLGYNPYAPLAQRQAAAERWARAVAEGRFGP